MNTADQLAQEALEYHSCFPAGKIKITPSKSHSTQKDLSLAYSPGVAAPCMEIYKNSQKVYDYTSKGNLVAVITNGTAVLGLGNIGAMASKPVMEGKGLLFKIFAGIDVFDIEISESDPEKFIQAVKAIAPTFGGINLEDIKAPEAFEIERRLRAELNIPVMHDDQHGTAIISGAALINALELVGKKIEEVKVVVNGAGAAAISCTRIYKRLGVRAENIMMCDSKGVIRTARKDLNREKREFAVDTSVESLSEALEGADVFIGLSVANVLSEKMLLTMAKDPIVFAMANPDPEIPYELAVKVRPDAIVATGRSDYPNQVNNVLGFPYIFRGALDVQATTINEEMKLAAVFSLANLAKAAVPEKVSMAYNQKDLSFGRTYIIPKPFDHRLITHVASAVAKAAMESGAARKEITNWDAYKEHLLDRMDIDGKAIRMIQNRARTAPKRIVFCNGEEHRVIKAAQILKQEGIAYPILLGSENRIVQQMKKYNIDEDLSIVDLKNPNNEQKIEDYADIFWKKKQRRGITLYDARKLMQTPDYFGSMMVDQNGADLVITGSSRSFSLGLQPILEVIGKSQDTEKPAAMMVLLTKRGLLFLADTAVTSNPSSEDLVCIALMVSQAAKNFGMEPNVAMLSFDNFSCSSSASKKVKQAVAYLHKNHPDLSVDGGIQPDFALNELLTFEKFPFSKLSGKRANVFVFPNLASSDITYKFIRGLGEVKTIGPIILGIKKPAHLIQTQSGVEEIVDLATFGSVHAQTFKQ